MFNEYILKILKECDVGAPMTDGGVYGGSGSDYAPGDNRVPYVMGPMLRRLGKKKRRHKKKRK